MVDSLVIGIIGVQGAVEEHFLMMQQLIDEYGSDFSISARIIRKAKDFEEVDGVIIPGGESTTISQMLKKKLLFNPLEQRIKDHSICVMGTCAGCVLLAKQVVGAPKDLSLLYAMDMEVKRNAFGRQRESFERFIDIKGIGKLFPAVFIRAPVITKVWESCQILARSDDAIVMAEDNTFLGVSFHPELTKDLRVHNYFLSKVEKQKS